ncbi:DNA-3-methyladenine glycosylase 2 family protein [Alteromonas sp. ASW11-130]|uniref:DNA-3-methyladenine glycosylase 2 family protein n=1 Tax=Alteromonas sp. ASW11-130 TaxID=3015775 RepID=UPI002241FA8B|nr:AlkA N-terminal domain-containing protein [Alteromonas sp. ASW11-130]MCW8093228.1 helix-turn-helix domain-containing protein [Alteromonas sp. ASW11-130]
MTESTLQTYQIARASRDRRFDGKFFVAVKTTGIFCRPICPARLPAEKNVEYYDLAAQAMEHGYRPCLRCRPDSAPGSCAWQGVNTTIQRAQSLLSEIPIEPVEHIAARLGISSRYLNKLFIENLGVSPKRFQLSNQLMLAKRLLQDTMLPIEMIAEAAGFSSTRRLQSLIKQHWQLTPSAIRKKSQKEVCQLHTAAVKFELAYRPPYNWEWVRNFLSQRTIVGVEIITENAYTRVFEINGRHGQVTATHNAERFVFDVEIKLEDLTYLQKVIRIISRVLDVEADPDLIENALRNSGLTAKQVCEGLRLPGAFNEFEAGCRAILGQQVTLNAATKQLNNLVANLSQPSPYGLAFPTPLQIASSDLTFLRMPQQRKIALRQFSELFCEAKGNRPSNEAILAVKGIGEWTLNYFLIRGCGAPDIFLEGDLIARNMAKKLSTKVNDASPWRSYLTLNMWYLATQEMKKC